MADPFDAINREIRDKYEDNDSALERWRNDEPYAHALYDIWTGNSATGSGGEWRGRSMGEFWDVMARYGIEKYDGTFDWRQWKQEYEANVGGG